MNLYDYDMPSDDQLAEMAKPNGLWSHVNAMAREILRLRAELAKAKRALERAGFVDNGGEEWKPPLGPSASPLLVELDHLRSELAKASAEVQRLHGPRLLCDKDGKPIVCGAPPPKFTPEQIAECMTDAPPADVLGEAFEEYMERAGNEDGPEFEQAIYSAVRELSEAVERIARAQRGGK